MLSSVPGCLSILHRRNIVTLNGALSTRHGTPTLYTVIAHTLATLRNSGGPAAEGYLFDDLVSLLIT